MQNSLRLGSVLVVMLGFGAGMAGAESDGLTQSQYQSQFPLYDRASPHWPTIKNCLAAWGVSHPFKSEKDIKFRLMESSVRVFGLGNTVKDHAKTSYPQLILVRPPVSVMSKTTFELMNPNGWYCIEGGANVMGKSVIKVACETHLANTTGSTAVLGSSGEQSGTTVMGKTVVQRRCD